MHARRAHVRAEIDRALERFPDIVSLAIDTWGCDYVLLRGGEEVWPCYAYRDSRTETVIPALPSSTSPRVCGACWGVNTPKPLTDPKSQAARVEGFKELFRKVM